MLWPPEVKSQLTGKDSDAGKDSRHKRTKRTRWHHRLNRHEFGQTPGDGEGQGSLVCPSPWGRKESDMT